MRTAQPENNKTHETNSKKCALLKKNKEPKILLLLITTCSQAVDLLLLVD